MIKKEEQLDFLFKRISVKLNRSPAQFEEIIEILKKNWYDTESSLREAKDEDFEKMKIPVRIVSAIREDLQSERNHVQTPQKQSPKKIQKNLNQQAIHSLCSCLEQNLKEGLPSYEAIFSTTKILAKIIKNLVEDSYQLKYRILKKSNKAINQNIFSIKPCLEFMKAIGFEQGEQALEIKTYEVHQFMYLGDCLQHLVFKYSGQQQYQPRQEQKRFIGSNEIPQSHQVDLSSSFSKEQIAEKKYVDLLHQLEDFRYKIMSSPPSTRNLKIYHKKYEKKITQFPQTDLEHEAEVSQDAHIAKYWKDTLIQNNKNQQFQSKRKLEFDHLIKQKVYKYSLVRIKLPNELIIEGVFGALETLQQVFKFVAEIVVGDLYLYTTPPKKKVTSKELNSTLYDLDSVPMGIFYLGATDDDLHINQEFDEVVQK